MRYLLEPDIYLRSYKGKHPCYYQTGKKYSTSLDDESFSILKRADGHHYIKDSKLLTILCVSGFLEPCGLKGKLLPNQILDVNNHNFPSINWMMTGKCNYNCRHCFNASDNSPLNKEYPYEDGLRLIKQAAACGIHGFTITGGEPFLHPHFFDFIQAIEDEGMDIDEINTNGSFLTDEAIAKLTKLKAKPLMKISFDNLGGHDWLRQCPGAEEVTLDAMRRCIKAGLKVMVQTNVHKGNIDATYKTACLLDEMGVSTMRIIRTSESPRWLENGKGLTLGFKEYFDFLVDFSKKYAQGNHKMDIILWDFGNIYPKQRSYAFIGTVHTKTTGYGGIPLCTLCRSMVAIGADGELYPCLQMSGYWNVHFGSLGNVIKNGLQPYLQRGDFYYEVSRGIKEVEQSGCKGCRHFPYCHGGCRAFSLIASGERLGKDLSKCLFYKEGYYQKMKQALPGYKNLSMVKELEEESI